MISNRFLPLASALILSTVTSGGGALAAEPQCAFTGPPAVAYGRRTDPDPRFGWANELVVADSGARCQLTVYTLPPNVDGDRRIDLFSNSVTFRFLPNPAGGGTGIIIWGTIERFDGGSCPRPGLGHAVFEVDSAGNLTTALPLVPTMYCSPDESREKPSISQHGDRLAFYSLEQSGYFLVIADAVDGKSLASGIDLSDPERIEVDALATIASWSPSDQALFHYGRLPADAADDYVYIYEIRDQGGRWDARKLVRLDGAGVDGVERRARGTTAALWNYDGSGPREVLAYGVVETWKHLPVAIEIIDVALTVDPTRPAVASRIPGPFAKPAFSGHVAGGTPPNLFVLDEGTKGRPIIEIDPATGECVPEGVCTTIGPTGSNDTQPAAGIGTPTTPEPEGIGPDALPVIIDLLLDEDSAAPAGGGENDELRSHGGEDR